MILLAAMACNKENVREEYARGLAEGETKVSLQGKIALPQGEGELLQTKVEFDDVDGKFTWSAQGDTIAVHVTAGMRGEKEMIPTGYKKAMVVPNDPASNCDLFFVMSETQERDFFAIYPASVVDEENYGDDELKVNLPSEYEIPAAGMDSWCPTPMVAVNDPSIESLSFRHIGGLLRLTLNDVSPATASFEVSLGKRITGSFTVNNPASSVPAIVTDDAAADVLTFNLAEAPSTYTDNFILNVPVPTGSYEMLSVKAKNGNGDIIFSYEDEDERSFYSGRGRHSEASISTAGIPLCLEAIEEGAVVITNLMDLTMEYSFDNKNWTSVSERNIYIPFNPGDCVYLRGNNEKYSIAQLDGSDLTGTTISTDGKCYIYGNIMSLIDAENFTERFEFTEIGPFVLLFAGATDLRNHPEKTLELPATTLTEGCYAFMFQGCTGLTTPPTLPATSTKYACYGWMFYGCTSLTETPDLPAESVAQLAYARMFAGCTSLVDAPDLPATTVGEEGYCQMFYQCTSLVNPPSVFNALSIGDNGCEAMFRECSSLTSAPALPATTLGRECYDYMFYDCTSLTDIPELAARDVPSYGYSRMFSGCSSLVNVPDITVDSVDNYGMYRMFSGCTSLKASPEISVGEVANYGLQSMFEGCSSIETAPEITVGTAGEYGLGYMFNNCGSLETVSGITVGTTGQSSMSSMFTGCSSLETVGDITIGEGGRNVLYNAFYNLSSLKTVGNITFETSMGEYACGDMFSNCTALESVASVSAPAISNNGCYNMFQGCTSLTSAPALPSTSLGESCYYRMFLGCSSLVTAPELPALVLSSNCYGDMFYGCSSLNHIKAMFTTDPSTVGFGNWLYGVSSTGTFEMNDAATWDPEDKQISSILPSGWTIVRVTE